MKNFLIIVLALGLAAAAFLTRPDREEFQRYVSQGGQSEVADAADDIEFKDYVLWTVVKRDGRTIYTGLFDRWIDNDKVKASLPLSS